MHTNVWFWEQRLSPGLDFWSLKKVTRSVTAAQRRQLLVPLDRHGLGELLESEMRMLPVENGRDDIRCEQC